jgi:hypothetical protein
MTPAVSAILTLIEQMPAAEQQQLQNAIGQRFSLPPQKIKENKLSQVLKAAQLINSNTPNPNNSLKDITAMVGCSPGRKKHNA